jgi:glycosyltransferase involved in cell wall biosynthesis
VTAPTDEALGNALARLADDERLARELGTNARQAVSALTWESVVKRLVIV